MPDRNVVGEGGGEDVGSKAVRKKAVLGFDEVEDGDRNADWMASQGSRSGRIRTTVKKMVQDACDFFRWADPKVGGALRNSEIVRCRKKITTLKTRLKDVEWKLRIVATLGVVGWIGFLYLLLHNPHNLRQPYGMHLIRR
ncbi:uncharacterized protein DS421_14g478990 [Arachis hypogaea]|nr:uncharacterized protein DS421_14g478990 [Arachis hypogaea]